ncbi:MAG: phytoene/squalene synthase family protein [Candidatus Binatia bacterium]
MRPTDITAADMAACHAAIRRHSRSFYAASRLLPLAVRDAAVAIYAFCRAADDAVDDAVGPAEARVRHADTRRQLDRIYGARPVESAAGRAFAQVAVVHGIPRAEPEALLDGMAQDLDTVRIPDEEELLLYCYRAAGVVGRMMSRIMGAAGDEALTRAVHLGIAMQLTNIARDVGEDARNNRIYLPAIWLAEAGGSAEEVLRARPSAAGGRVTLRILDLAERYYASGILGIALLPARCRPAILSAALLYRAIGRQVRARDGDGVSARARVGAMHKAGLIAVAVTRCALDPRLRVRAGRPDVDPLPPSLPRAGIAS